MSLQVNLLKRSERRHQGIVSMKVMVFSAIGLLTGITVLISLLTGISKITIAAELKYARQEFQQLEPQVEKLRAVQTAEKANREMLAHLKSWTENAGPPMYAVLRSLQKNIPADMRLYHLFAGTEQTAEKETSAYTLRISGTANGELTAVETKRQLNAAPELRQFCGEIRLVSSRRHFDESWAFVLEGRRPIEESK